MYLIKALRVECIKSKRTMLNIIPFVLSIIVVSSIFFLCRTSSKDEIVSESIHYWISISAMIAPLLVGILAGIMGEQEQEAGNYQVIRRSVHKGQNWLFIIHTDFLCPCLYGIIIHWYMGYLSPRQLYSSPFFENRNYLFDRFDFSCTVPTME